MEIFILLTIISLSIFIGWRLRGFLNEWKKKKKIDKKVAPQTQQSSLQTGGLLEKMIMLEEEISILRQLSQNISSYQSLNDLAREIVETTCKILNLEICALLLLDEDTGILSTAASIGIEDKLAGQIRIKKGDEISGAVAKYNVVKIINDLEKQTPLYQLKYDRCYKNSLMSLPLCFKDKVLGVLNTSTKKSGNPFSPDDVKIINVIALESAVAIQNAKLYEELQKNYLNTIISLASTIDARDPYTHRHSKNVTKYAVRLAQEIKLPTQVIENIRYAGLLHDIGKISIKDEILLKAGKLTEEEYHQIKTHPVKAEEIIKTLPFLAEVTHIIRHHHERFDGNGYPDGIKGENIEVGARILMIADVFDAMTTNRPYRKALSLAEAKNELIKNKDTQFDPHIADYFLHVLEKEPNLINESDIAPKIVLLTPMDFLKPPDNPE